MTFKSAYRYLLNGQRVKRTNWNNDMYVLAKNPTAESILDKRIYLVTGTTTIAITDNDITSWFNQPKRYIHDWIVLKNDSVSTSTVPRPMVVQSQ
jgi:hypothetical protein